VYRSVDCLGKAILLDFVKIIDIHFQQCCFFIYERFAEAILSLFVPFYNEFKSIAILFLILTRARVGHGVAALPFTNVECIRAPSLYFYISFAHYSSHIHLR
jgi:hypothetical protein